MSGPLIPYIEAPELPLAFLQYIPFLGDSIDPASPPSIKPFGTLVAIGVYVGATVTMRRAAERGLDTKKMNDAIFWIVATGFVISHMLDAIAYHPETVMKDPLYLLRIWDGLSSYGGFIGAVLGAIAWKLYRKEKILEIIDLCVAGMPIAWVFGRMGCSVVHDHPGALSNAWYAVQFPERYLADGFAGRFDLGFIEMVLTIPLAVAVHYLWKRQPKRPVGFYIAVCLTTYAPVRFVIDFLRVAPDDPLFRGATDPRYGGLTPAQWACFLAVAVGGYFFYRTWNQPYERNAPEAPLDEQPDEAKAEPEAQPDEAEPGKKRKKKKKKRAKKALPATDTESV